LLEFSQPKILLFVQSAVAGCREKSPNFRGFVFSVTAHILSLRAFS
jgi:hypothetical protein